MMAASSLRGAVPATRAALDWLDNAAPGYCAATDVGGDCRTDNKGSFRIDGTEAHFSWLEAAERCMVRCLNCERCNHMTVAIIREGLWSVDCSWYYACARPLHALNGRNMHGFYHGPVPQRLRSAAALLPPPFAWPSTPALPRSNAAVALQLSGHFRSCSYPSVVSHLAACRARFARCDLFVHSWATMAPATVHWSGLFDRGANVSSAQCLAQLKAELRPAAVAVDEQGPPPPRGAAAPDGQAWTEGEAYHWGPARYWGYLMALRGMRKAGILRQRRERSEGMRYVAAMRLRPDDKANGGFEGMAASDYAPLWDCLRAKTTSAAWTDSAAASGYDGAASASGPPPEQREIVGCAPVARLSVGSTGNDNCFFGPPRALDAFLRPFERNASAVYAEAKRRGASLSRHESAFLPVAAAMAGVRLATHAYVPGSARVPTPRLTSCHRDDLRLLLLPEVEGLQPTAPHE